jgi:hypothetical protein
MSQVKILSVSLKTLLGKSNTSLNLFLIGRYEKPSKVSETENLCRIFKVHRFCRCFKRLSIGLRGSRYLVAENCKVFHINTSSTIFYRFLRVLFFVESIEHHPCYYDILNSYFAYYEKNTRLAQPSKDFFCLLRFNWDINSSKRKLIILLWKTVFLRSNLPLEKLVSCWSLNEKKNSLKIVLSSSILMDKIWTHDIVINWMTIFRCFLTKSQWLTRISPIRLSPTGHSPMAKVHCTFANIP